MPFHCPATLLNFQIDSLSLTVGEDIAEGEEDKTPTTEGRALRK
jgi:hypothetical protein